MDTKLRSNQQRAGVQHSALVVSTRGATATAWQVYFFDLTIKAAILLSRFSVQIINELIAESFRI